MDKLKLLAWILKLHALVLLLALVPICFPTAWMESIHVWLGLGELPRGPIVEYLTRSLSLGYALHGAVCLTLALDVRRYLDLIQRLALFHLGFGLVILLIDIRAGLPWYWIVGEGPPIMAFAVFIYTFAGHCRGEVEAAGPGSNGTPSNDGDA